MKPSRREWCDKKNTTSVTAFSGAPSGTLPRAKERRTVAFLTALACRRPVRVSPMVPQMIQARHRREAWASAVNRALEEKQQSARVTHLSHAALGLDEQPTAHEGSQARKLEMQGIVPLRNVDPNHIRKK